jgi:hypothetical protein
MGSPQSSAGAESHRAAPAVANEPVSEWPATRQELGDRDRYRGFVERLGLFSSAEIRLWAIRWTLGDFTGPMRGAAWNRRYFLIVDVQQLSRNLGLLVMFKPISKLPDFIVPRLPKQNRQIEEKPRKIPIRSRGKRACGASACLAESSGA